MRHGAFRHGLILSLLVSTLAGAPGSALAETSPRAAIASQAIEKVIRPGYERLDKAGEAEAKAFDTLCAKPDEAALVAARQSFGELAQAFGAVEFITFGPIAEGSRLERYLFWPDRRGAAQRQAQIIVNRRNADAATSDLLPRQSVAVQGLTALEYVLFGAGSDNLTSQVGAFRCRYGATIVGNLGQISDAVAEQWRNPNGFAGRLTQPKPADPVFRSPDDVLALFLTTAVRGLDEIGDTRLAPGLAASQGETPSNLFLFGRSGHDTAMLVADIEGLRALLAQSGLLALTSALSLSPDTELGAVAVSIRSLGPDLGSVVQTKEGRAKLAAALERIKAVRAVLADELAPALGLRIEAARAAP